MPVVAEEDVRVPVGTDDLLMLPEGRPPPYPGWTPSSPALFPARPLRDRPPEPLGRRWPSRPPPASHDEPGEAWTCELSFPSIKLALFYNLC